MNIYCGVVISGQETGPECFVDLCHMTRETETERQRPSYKSERVNELLSSGALRPKTGLHGGQRLKQTHKHTHRCYHIAVSGPAMGSLNYNG